MPTPRLIAVNRLVLLLLVASCGRSFAAEEVYLEEPGPVPPPKAMGKLTIPEKYEDGALRVEREAIKMSDDTYVNDGKFVEYYRDGQKFAEGTFDHGVHQGQWTFWHPNGQVCKVVTFKQGDPDGAWDVFTAEGKLQMHREYAAGKRTGKWVDYYPDGETPRTETTYEAGKLQGPRITYHTNGQVQQQSSFKDNLYDGVMTEFDESGRKLAEATFKAGKREGKLTRWAADGTTTEIMFHDDKPVAE